MDPTSKLAKQFDVKGYPTFYLIDKNGEVIHKSAGYGDGTEEEYLEALKSYFTNENIEYEAFEYERKNDNKKEAINIDF